MLYCFFVHRTLFNFDNFSQVRRWNGCISASMLGQIVVFLFRYHKFRGFNTNTYITSIDKKIRTLISIAYTNANVGSSLRVRRVESLLGIVLCSDCDFSLISSFVTKGYPLNVLWNLRNREESQEKVVVRPNSKNSY